MLGCGMSDAALHAPIRADAGAPQRGPNPLTVIPVILAVGAAPALLVALAIARGGVMASFLLLTLISALSTLLGLHVGTVPDWTYSLLLQVKRVEYFLIFWVVATTVRSELWLRALVLLFVASGALAALYGLAFPHSDPNIVA